MSEAQRRDQQRFDALRRLSRRARYDQANRLGLLVVHCLIGWAATLTFGTKVPITWTAVVGDNGVAAIIATAVPGIGATLLLLGLLSNRNLPLEATGLAMLLAWDLVGLFAVYKFLTSPVTTAPLQYQFALYGGLAALLTVHLVTIVAFKVESRRGRI